MIITQDNEEDVKRFNEFYSANYQKINTWAKQHKIPEDTVHDSYLILQTRISKVGFIGSTFMTYIKLSAKNLHINNLKKCSKKYFIDVFDMDWEVSIENILQELDDVNSDNLLYQEQLMFFSKMLFKYLSSKYDDEWMFVFKTYYLLEKSFTYNKLNKITNISKNKCTLIITTMKADLRQNLLEWIKKSEYVN